MHDTALHEEIELVSELMVAVSDRTGPMRGVELDRALGLGDSIRSDPTAHERGWARIAAVNAQYRPAPTAREASGRVSSGMAIQRHLLAISRGRRD